MYSDDDIYSDSGYDDDDDDDDDDDNDGDGCDDDGDANASADGDSDADEDDDDNDDDDRVGDDEEDHVHSDDESEEDIAPLPSGNGGYYRDPDDRLENIPQQIEKVYLEFDGASKGNAGRAGAGAVLKDKYGKVITRIREGLGNDTNNGAEYKALIQGLKTALEKGYDHIEVQGDSELVYKQVQGHWQTRNDNMTMLCKEARELMSQFKEFRMKHVPRGYNTDADAEANKGVNLPAGRVEKEDNPSYRRRR